LQVALVAEKNAHNFYARLIEQTKDVTLLYTELAVTEDGHVDYLEALVEVSAAEVDKEVN
jgi:rubrerythrin